MPAPPCCLESGRASLWAYSIAHLPPLGSETSILSRPRIFHLAPPYSGTTLPETLSNSKLIGSSSTGVKEKWQHTCCVLSDFNSISAMGMCDKPGQPAAAGVCVCVCVCALSYVWLFATPRTIAHQGPQSMGFPRQEYWSLPFPTPMDLPDLGLVPTSFVSPALAGSGFFRTAPPGWEAFDLIQAIFILRTYQGFSLRKPHISSGFASEL